MRAKAVLVISLVFNVAVAAVLWTMYRSSRETGTEGAQLVPVWSNNTIRVAKTNVVLNSRVFNWQNIESSNYDLYVTNLRGIGCPETTVRDIIVADVAQLFARKRKEMNTTTNDVKWWRSEPDPDEVQAALEREKALDDQRRQLLTRLLGTNWEQTVEKEAEPLVLAGPVLGALGPEQKQHIQELMAQSRAQVQDYLRQCEEAGESPDPAELSRMREQTRHELREQLTDEQLEEFLLRYSNNASQLRGELRGFDTSPEEFRKVFNATDLIDRELQFLGTEDDPATVAERKRLEQRREDAIRQALGPERYDAYRMLVDVDYRSAMSEAQQAGAPAQAGRSLYEINQAAVAEKQRINNDASLTAAEKDEELKQIDLQQQAARASVLGLPVPEEAIGASAPGNVFQHRAGPHDTLGGLSLYYRVPLSDLIRANPGLDPGDIQPGATVKIPEPSPLPWKQGVLPQR